MERQFAAGGVVIKKERGLLRVLLIKDSYGHWIWAKGHIEKNESPEEAAIREVSEETGLEKIQVVERLGKQEYYFTLKEKRIFKIVEVFLIKATFGEKLAVQTLEVQAAQWFSPEEAVSKIEYEGSRDLLQKAINVFRRKFC